MRQRRVCRKTFTFLVSFNFHLHNNVIYMCSVYAWRAAHVSTRCDAIVADRSSCVIVLRDNATQCAWVQRIVASLNALTHALEDSFVHCLPAWGWHCDTFILGQFFTAPIVLEIRHRRRVHETRYYLSPLCRASSDDFSRIHCISSYKGYF